MTNIDEKINSLNPIAQNIIMGAVTGILTGYIIREVFRRTGGYDLVWILMVVIGPLVGFLSGRERQRLEKMKLEKSLLEEDFDKLQSHYKQAVNKYRLLFENINDAIYLTSQDGRFLLFNEAMCLISGYSRDELKAMKTSQLQVDEESIEDHKRAWLDNGICRFEERWKTRDGTMLNLDVNSKWIKLARNQYILHIARDNMRREGTDDDSKIGNVRRFHENRLNELAKASQAFYRLIATPIGNTFNMLSTFGKQYPSESGKINEAVSDWERVKKMLQELAAKNARDTQSIDSEWKVNDVIMQELYYLDIIGADQNVMVSTHLASDLPGVYATGSHLSVVFGSVFLALVRTLQKSPNKKMTVSTRYADEHVVVEIKAPQAGPFEKLLSQAMDPSLVEDGDAADGRGMTLIGFILDLFKGKLDVTRTGNENMTVTIRILTARWKRTVSEGTSPRKGPKPPVIF
jgi:PAS domain S-box-containing protein